jgi:hypothetical protein
MIDGNLEIHNISPGPTQNQICGVNLNGNLQFHNNGTPVQIGSPSSSCVGNLVGGNLDIHDNSAPTQVFDNTVSGKLQCHNNASTQGGGNTASQKQGQCATF